MNPVGSIPRLLAATVGIGYTFINSAWIVTKYTAVPTILGYAGKLVYDQDLEKTTRDTQALINSTYVSAMTSVEAGGNVLGKVVGTVVGTPIHAASSASTEAAITGPVEGITRGLFKAADIVSDEFGKRVPNYASTIKQSLSKGMNGVRHGSDHIFKEPEGTPYALELMQNSWVKAKDVWSNTQPETIATGGKMAASVFVLTGVTYTLYKMGTFHLAGRKLKEGAHYLYHYVVDAPPVAPSMKVNSKPTLSKQR